MTTSNDELENLSVSYSQKANNLVSPTVATFDRITDFPIVESYDPKSSISKPTKTITKMRKYVRKAKQKNKVKKIILKTDIVKKQIIRKFQLRIKLHR